MSNQTLPDGHDIGLVSIGLMIVAVFLMIWHYLTVWFIKLWDVLVMPIEHFCAYVSSTSLGGMLYRAFDVFPEDVNYKYHLLLSYDASSFTKSEWQSVLHMVGVDAKPLIVLILATLLGLSIWLLKRGKFKTFYDYKALSAYLTGKRKVSNLPSLAHDKLINENQSKNEDISSINQTFLKSLGSPLSSPYTLKITEAQALITLLLENLPLKDRDEVLKELSMKHVYETTFICAVYEKVKEMLSGNAYVLMEIKKQHYALWRALLSLGRPVIYKEAAAIICMYYAEKNESNVREDFVQAYEDLIVKIGQDS